MEFNPHQFKHTVYCLVQRAMLVIHDKLQTAHVEEKATHYKDIDFVTEADFAAQNIIVSGLREAFPFAGIVAEENGLNTPVLDGLTFVIDPLDGTKAYVRKESSGVSVMVAAIYRGEIIAVFIGNTWTKEIYYYRPASTNTHRLLDFHRSIKLQPFDLESAQKRFYLLFRDDPYEFHTFAPQTANFDFQRVKAAIKGFNVSSGSIGVTYTQLWNQTVAGIILRYTTYTPWDTLPVYGLSKRLGYEHYKFQDGRFVPHPLPDNLFEVQTVNELVLVCHPSMVDIIYPEVTG